MSPDQPNAHTDFNLIETGYRFLSDDSAFDACVQAWTSKFSDLELQAAARSLDDDPFIKSYASSLTRLVDKLGEPTQINPLQKAINDTDAAAMVIAPNGLVVLANDHARARFNAVPGRRNDMLWLDPGSTRDFQSVKSPASGTRRQHAIVRTRGTTDEVGTAEVFSLSDGATAENFIVVRAFETPWSDAMDQTLKTAFQLTTAERKIARALYEIRTTAEIAKQRRTNTNTIRIQIRSIFRKTETKSQVDLVRLIALVNARVSNAKQDASTTWKDPWQNYEILRRPDGRRLAYTWTGKRGGTPALLVHGCVQGYLLGETIERAVYDAGIQLFAVIRPGFGDSDCPEGANFANDQATAIEWLLETLGVRAIPAIGIGNGAVPLFRLATARPDLVSNLLVTGLLMPYDRTSIQALTPTQRVFSNLLLRTPQLSKVLARVCMNYIHQKGAQWYLDKGWRDVPEVRKTLSDPEILPLIIAACELTLTADRTNYPNEMRTKWDMDPGLVAQVPCPIHHLHGVHDRSVRAEEAQALEKTCPTFTSECIEDAGYFLIYEKPALFADRLIKAVTGTSPTRKYA